MFFQISVGWESLEAARALEGSLARVFPLMDGQVHPGVVALWTSWVLTLVLVPRIWLTRRITVYVDLLNMGLQMVLKLEGFVAPLVITSEGSDV